MTGTLSDLSASERSNKAPVSAANEALKGWRLETHDDNRNHARLHNDSQRLHISSSDRVRTKTTEFDLVGQRESAQQRAHFVVIVRALQ